ncbi:MAG: hypothetical protein QXV55_04765 [Acidilobaceae archaeon]
MFRVVLRPYSSLPLECDLEELEVCEWAKGPEVYPGVSIRISQLVSLASRWYHDLVFLDGIEPLAEVHETFSENLFKRPLCARTQGLVDVEIPRWLSCLLIEDMSLIGGPSLDKRIVELLELCKSSNIHVEVVLYAKSLEGVKSSINFELATRFKIPFHIVFVKPSIESLRKVYEEFRKANPFIYIHSEPFYELDTYCEVCGTLLAQRSRYSLISIVEGNACPKCGSGLPFKEKRETSWKKGVIKALRGRPLWFNVLALRLVDETPKSEESKLD